MSIQATAFRILFCAAPAIGIGGILGGLLSLAHPHLLEPVLVGLIVAVCVFGLGWQVTREDGR